MVADEYLVALVDIPDKLDGNAVRPVRIHPEFGVGA